MGISIFDSRLREVKRRIQDAALRVDRMPDSVKLVAVTKRFPVEVVKKAAEQGIRCFGENYVQEGCSKVEALKEEFPGIEWHLIGHLQKNKVRQAAECFQWIETVDSLKLLELIVKRARQLGKRPYCLLQVNISKDPAKSGLLPKEAESLLRHLTHMDISPVELRGLMTIPAYAPDPQASRPWYRGLRRLRDYFLDEFQGHFSLEELSMGMSHDFEVAIEEGATIVRVGQALFGPRNK